MNAGPVLEHLLQRHDAVLDRLSAFLKLPSVSTDPAYADSMEATRNFLLDWLTGIGLSDALAAAAHRSRRSARGTPSLAAAEAL